MTSSLCLRRLPLALIVLGLPALLPGTARAQTTTSGGGTTGGSLTVTLTSAQYVNLSQWDCNNPTTLDFQYSGFNWVSGQQVEYLLSSTSDCEAPENATIQNSTTYNDGSALIAPVQTLNEPTNGVTDYNSTVGTQYPLITKDMWYYYTTSTGTGAYPIPSSNTTFTCPVGVDNELIYLCVLIDTPGEATDTPTFGYLSIALDSDAPSAPTGLVVKPLDSGLAVSWASVSNAYYYIVHVQQTPGTDFKVTSPLAGQTSANVFGLTNGTQYTVYVVALDDAGSNPPTTSNISANSTTATGTPVPSYSFFQEYKNDGGAENGGCDSTGGPAILALGLGIVLLRRRKRRPFIGAAVLIGALGLSHPARAADSSDEAEETTLTPMARQASPEWFRVELIIGPFNMNPDSESGLKGTPFAQVFPNRNQILTTVAFYGNVYSGFGHLSLGLEGAFWVDSGHSLLAGGAQASDVETFNIFPITPMLSYRADFIFTKWNVPIVPFVKVGWGFVPWFDVKNGNVEKGIGPNGQTWYSEGLAMGLQWGGGIEFPLGFLDPQRSINLDEDFGINDLGIFGEFQMSYWTGTNGGIPLGGAYYAGGLYITF